MNVFGYISASEALSYWFTHHGKYYGIPVWIAPDAGFMVATKWELAEPVMIVATWIEGFLLSVFYPDDEPTFQFLLGPKIAATMSQVNKE